MMSADTPEALSPTPPPPPKEITICQAEEPNTLFILGGASRAAYDVLEAVYDGPIDTRSYRLQPVILEKIPTIADGDVSLRSVIVRERTRVVNTDGDPVDLQEGVMVLSADGQELTFTGGSVTMAQIVVTFTLRPDVTWADGQPLTVDDSRYAFDLASQFDDPALRRLPERTQSYDPLDERTIVWVGLPGYRDPLYSLNFFPPLPRHVYGDLELANLLNTEAVHRKPLGWGAFAIEEWIAGDRITLVRNPHYFRAAEGLPHLDRVTFRFVPNLDQALDMLSNGECDLIHQDLIEGRDTGRLMEFVTSGALQLVAAPSSTWMHLDFGIQPASWVQRPDFFGDVRTRQAIAMCIDRGDIAERVFPADGALVAHSYIPFQHPQYATGQLYQWDYDPAAGQTRLAEVGWWDENGDGILEAHGVPGVAAGVPFSVTLSVSDDYPLHKQVAEALAEDLALCGIGVSVETLPAEEFYADGPDGLVFGRQFDLALFSWLNGLEPPCELYLSDQVPGAENWWAASNDPGYVSPDYDAACRTARRSLPGVDEYTYFHQQAQRIFSHDLPVLPLYFIPQTIGVRPGVTGVVLDPGEYLPLWNIEAFDVTW